MSSNDTNQWRSDWRFIKHVAKTYGDELASAYQRLPYIEISGERSDHMLLNPQEFDLPSPAFMPFDDFFVSLLPQMAPGFGHLSGQRFPYIYRFTNIKVYEAKAPRLSPWWAMFSPPGPLQAYYQTIRSWNPDDTVFHVEAWPFIADAQTFPEFPLAFIQHLDPTIHRAIVGKPIGAVHPTSRGVLGYVRELAGQGKRWEHEEMFKTIISEAQDSVTIMSYLQQTPEHLVETRPSSPTASSEAKKPWTRPNLSRYILLDPTTTKVAASSPADSKGGTHAPPRPHQRRAHWATLRNPRFYKGVFAEMFNPKTNPRRVFVKPAWIGPREWIDQGNRYRVVTPQEPQGGQA